MGGIKKKDLKKALRKLARIKTWQLLIILVLSLFIEATLLRFNHIHMTDLKAEVAAADEAGDEEAIKSALNKLNDYVRSHIVVNVVEKNGISRVTFGSGPVYLENQYNRKASAALEEAEANAATDENPNGNVFAKAMAVCQPLAQQNGWTWDNPDYINCYTSEIAKYPASDRIEDTYAATLPSTALFRYDFASPVWTFSPAGLMGIVCIALGVIVLVRFIIWLLLKVALLFIKN
ncbi:hypothetical protein IKW75_02695 [Candidatus Saccharibacteria bacterium]|nr:hypothetical protein [Candidatus Saccharibacteria bacterium]